MYKIVSGLLFSLLPLVFLPISMFASTPVNTEDHPAGKINMVDFHSSPIAYDYTANPTTRKTLRHQNKAAKMEARLEKLLARQQAKRGIDNLGDPTDRWFWLGAGSWTIGILITIIAGGTIGAVGLGIFWLLTFAFGAFSLITWLKKRYGD